MVSTRATTAAPEAPPFPRITVGDDGPEEQLEDRGDEQAERQGTEGGPTTDADDSEREEHIDLEIEEVKNALKKQRKLQEKQQELDALKAELAAITVSRTLLRHSSDDVLSAGPRAKRDDIPFRGNKEARRTQTAVNPATGHMQPKDIPKYCGKSVREHQD